jgi:hypothetical protein
MLRCAWCMKKIGENKPCYGLNVKFTKGVELNENKGEIIQVFLASRNTSVPLIVVADDSEAKKEGHDGIFSICSEKCGVKMKKTVNEELQLFSGIADLIDLS